MISKCHTKEKCKDYISKIPNYDKAISDTTQVWHCHHVLEISIDGEHELHSQDDLIRMGMYYKRPYYELIFLTPSEHRELHGRTVEARKRNSEQQKKVDRKGSKNPMAAENVKEKRKTNPNFGKKGKYKVFVHYAKSEEGRKIINHFGLRERTKESEQLYNSEMSYFRTNKKFSWE